MGSSIDICNRALIRAGAKGKISSLSEDTPNAVLCNLLYNPIRKNLLRKHFWNFALGLVELAQLTDAPTFEYRYAYGIPFDFLRLVRVYDYSYPWKVIGNQLHTDDTSVKLIYVKDFTDASKFDSLFEECLVLKLAYELCLKINENDSRTQVLKQEFERAVKEARQVDAMEDCPTQWFDDGTWNNSRYEPR